MMATRGLLGVAVVAVMALGCGGMPFGGPAKEEAKKDGAGTETKERVQLVLPVEAELAMRGDISEYFQTSSRVEAETKVDVTSEGSGVCKQVFVEEGDTVSRGDILAELDKEEATAQLREAGVTLNRNKADYERLTVSTSRGITAQQELDAAKFAYEQALETVTVRQVQLDNLTIRAHWDGIITHRSIQPGALVGSGTVAFSMVDPSTYVLAITVPERILSRVRPGQPAKVDIDAVPDKTFDAAVRRVNPAIDPATGKVKVLLDFEDEARQYMREAAFARVNLVMATRENALLVPKDAVLEENTRKFVFVVRPAEEESTAVVTQGAKAVSDDEPEQDSGAVSATPVEPVMPEAAEPPLMAERVNVEVGLEDSFYYEITSGIEEDDLIVTNGHHNMASMRAGTRIRITNATDEIMAKAGMSTEEIFEAAKANRKEAQTKDNDHRRRGGPGRGR